MSENIFIYYNTLVDMLKKFSPTFVLDDSWLVDEKYKSLNLKDLPQLIYEWKKWMDENKAIWVPDEYDCDDFAEDFRRLAVHKFKIHPLIALGKLYYQNEFLGYHAWNIVITHKWDPLAPNLGLTFRLFEIEPQTGEIVIDHISEDKFRYELWWVYG